MTKFLNNLNFQHGSPPPIGILLTNVGTPEAPTARALRPYLAQFLGDQRVIELPRWLWLPLLHGILLNVRPRRSAKLYKRVWTDEGSPLLTILRRQAEALEEELQQELDVPVRVAYGMRYGEPSIRSALRELHAANVRQLLVFPLYPQYSATTTATSFDAVFDELKTWRWMPELRTINHYHDHPAYITAISNTIQEHWADKGAPDRLLFSFHGIPQSYFLNGDPYFCECHKTARLIAEELDLPEDLWTVSFQSRFGPSEWLQPYTDETLEGWGHEKVGRVDALCPGFSADCLETVDEVGVEGRESFEEAGGGEFHYIPALNERPDHIAALKAITLEHLQGWTDRPAGLPPAALHRRVAAAEKTLSLNGKPPQTTFFLAYSRPKPERGRVVIVGGGIAGLAAAWELSQAAGDALEIILLEKDDRWGGKILTQTLTTPTGEKVAVDAGPESFVTRKEPFWQLVRELNLQEEILPLASEAQGTYVLDDGRPRPLPVTPGAFIRSDLLSWRGKLRLLAEPFVPRKKDDADESLADFATRRLGREALEKFIGPVLGGIYNTDPERQSILVTSPIMREMERDDGGLFAASVKRALRKSGKKSDAPPARIAGFRRGGDKLVEALVEQLAGSVDLCLNAAVTRIEAAYGGQGYEVILADGDRLNADGVILATTADVAARLLSSLAPDAAGRLAAIEHNHIGTASFLYRQADLTLDPPAKGLMIPRREKRRIDAVTWTSTKFRSRTPEGYEVLRVFFGGGDPATIDLSDEQLRAVIREELGELLGVTAEPLDVAIARWPGGYPQAGVGHLQLVADIEEVLPAGVHVAGSSYRGLAVPDCIEQGRESAVRLLAELAEGAVPAAATQAGTD